MDQNFACRYIMFADDDPDEREFFCEALGRIGTDFRLEVFKSGKELVAALNRCMLEECYPDLVFLDLNMPILNGWDTLQDIRSREKLKDVPVIAILTTSDCKADKRTAYDRGADAFIAKPSSFDSLRVLIEKAIGKDWRATERSLDNFLIAP